MQPPSHTNTVLNRVAIPPVAEDHMAAHARVPWAQGLWILCNRCGHAFPDDDPNHDQSFADIKKDTPTSKGAIRGALAADNRDSDTGREAVTDAARHPAAFSVRVQRLCAARIAIPDAQRPTVRMMCYATQWADARAKQVHALLCYIWSTLEYMQVGYISG